MITTRRLEETKGIYSNESRASVALLEREDAKAYDLEVEETYEQAQERMRRNLNKLLNKDNTAFLEKEETKVEKAMVDLGVDLTNDEDLKPSSTTMQFIEQDSANVNADMKKAAARVQANSGKRFLMVLYSLAVTVILALIVLNTGVLASLNKNNLAKQAELNGIFTEYNQKLSDIDSITNNEYVVDWAEQNGMAKR